MTHVCTILHNAICIQYGLFSVDFNSSKNVFAVCIAVQLHVMEFHKGGGLKVYLLTTACWESEHDGGNVGIGPLRGLSIGQKHCSLL